MCTSDRIINGLGHRLKLMSDVSGNNKVVHKEAGSTDGYEYYKGEQEGLRLAMAVLNELITHHNKE